MIQTLFDDIQKASNHLEGWASLEKQFCMASAVLALRPDISLEIGVYGGKSLFPLAFAHRAINKGRVIGVDPWQSTESAQGQPKEHADFWGQLDHERIRIHFMRQLKEFRLEHVTEIIRTTSDDYNPSPGISILSVDGNHGPQSIRDIERYAPMVLTGGLVFSDDLTWPGNNVATSIQKLLSLGFRELYRVQNKAQGGQDDWACYQRIK